ncbi:hypothetical protein NY035_01795 [Corynebacterium diphtheriae bv. mitis]|uniref:hypothetical protein n=1 Tax=Corynebacterium diphtheriae TaxID=1717 RepID=UPI0013C7B4F1|nr:hypothetical protein [Corynebacterium diphtheriae]MBG9359029.1 hypothetical protein [Corynebacterium diphtheriae bv. mitis]MBG9361127.1 hypothetical protein [Corynebacterium diphtheriae bv. mitis]MBG9363292.1 hypothetical protein [Corynebacterium diphtheriae bv. mitis]MBG9365434.1 hypothetical protein [Corynebacterium diphtheriae bv. mitis]UWE84725.1 hypothetical protein NY053_05080 [Corynebacterium diphtheriae bv. mitis]
MTALAYILVVTATAAGVLNFAAVLYGVIWDDDIDKALLFIYLLVSITVCAGIAYSGAYEIMNG